MSLEALAHDEVDATAARKAVWCALEDDDGYRAAYAALCRWTWRAMVERRLDDELRSWHRLLLDAAAKLASVPTVAEKRSRARLRLDPAAAAERMRALADVVRLSIDAAAASLPAELGKRAHVVEILRHLTENIGESVERELIRRSIGLGDANLSRVLTLMTANGLIERLPRGKVASFRATQRGLALVTAPDPRERERARAEMPPPLPPTEPERVKEVQFAPITVFRFDGDDISVVRDRSGQVDHEATYMPHNVIRGVFGKTGKARSSPRARQRNVAL